MNLTVKGKQIDVGDSLRQHVKDNLVETAEKYFPSPIEATVVFSKEAGHLFKADISIHLGKGILLQAGYTTEDPYPAFDTALDRIAKRMRRYKDKIRNHHKELPEVANMEAEAYTLKGADSEEDEMVGDEPAIIAELSTTIQTMSVSDAVMRLELADLPAMLFRNPKDGQINMVYKRNDGNIGWVAPKK